MARETAVAPENPLSFLKDGLTAIFEKREKLVSEIQDIDNALAELNIAIPGAAAVRRPRQQNGSSNTGTTGTTERKNPHTIKQLAAKVMRDAGQDGVSLEDLTKGILKAGYKTDTPFDAFSKSVNVTGINGLKTAGFSERVPNTEGRIAFYRLTAKGKAWLKSEGL